MRNLKFNEVIDHAAPLYRTLFYIVNRPELFTQIDQLSELLHLQGFVPLSSIPRFLRQDAAEYK